MVKKAVNEVPAEAAVQPNAPTDGNAAAPETPKTTKSIVPARYAGRYKKGGGDALAEFINAQCNEKEGFSFTKFWELCKKNGLDATKVDHYAAQVSEKRHGAQGRARMTLRNMLATIVRRDGKLVALDGTETPLSLPKLALGGAAATAAAKSSESAGEAVTSQF
jgi:hypothetical protein